MYKEAVKAWSWHYTHDHSRKFSFLLSNRIPWFVFNKTHKCLPLSCVVPGEALDDNQIALAAAFDFFNWAHLPDMYAGPKVNNFCAAHQTHASQSVGDIVELEGIGFWMVLGVGWKKLNFNPLVCGNPHEYTRGEF
jgi:hypothetical protein